MHVLRAEKGYIIIGQETDGTVTPDDAGLAWAIGKAKPDFVGKRSLARPAMTEPGRKQLVGLRTRDPKILLEEGAQIVSPSGPGVSIGHVTSSYHSPALKGSIALAMVRSEEHTSELQSLMRISYAVFCLKKKKKLERYTNN